MIGWPNLIQTRRLIFPVGERLFPKLRWTGEGYKREFAGVLEGVTIKEARTIVRSTTHVYPCNAAKLKYIDVEEGRIWENGSYAHRPDGFRGQYQTHVRLFPHRNGVALLCHWETNPWYDPRGHYGNTDGEWNPMKGVAQARDLYDLCTDCHYNDIQPRE